MNYPGDTYLFTLSLNTASGVAPTINVNPVITIVTSTGTALISSVNMTVIAGTQNQIWTYSWNTAGLSNGTYLALVSYSHDSITVNSQLLERVKLGDSFVVGVVAQDSTVAKESTLIAGDGTDYLTNIIETLSANSIVLQNIQVSTDNLPLHPADNDTLTSIQTTINQLLNAQLGTWIVDKTQSPNVLTFFNPDNSVLATFQLTDSSGSSNRVRVS